MDKQKIIEAIKEIRDICKINQCPNCPIKDICDLFDGTFPDEWEFKDEGKRRKLWKNL